MNASRQHFPVRSSTQVAIIWAISGFVGTWGCQAQGPIQRGRLTTPTYDLSHVPVDDCGKMHVLWSFTGSRTSLDDVLGSIVVQPLSGQATPTVSVDDEVPTAGLGGDVAWSVVLTEPEPGWYFVGFEVVDDSVQSKPEYLEGLGFGVRVNPTASPTFISAEVCPDGLGDLQLSLALSEAVTNDLSVDPFAITTTLDNNACVYSGTQANSSNVLLFTCPMTSTIKVGVSLNTSIDGDVSGLPVSLVDGSTTGSFTLMDDVVVQSSDGTCYFWRVMQP